MASGQPPYLSFWGPGTGQVATRWPTLLHLKGQI